MNISYNWLKSYINFDLSVNELAKVLTSLGLEVGSVEEVESVKGGLKGLVVGHVLTRVQHPNADKLSCTTVDVGGEAPLNIVCGAPNVAAGQKVIVATVGTALYAGEESFTIKKAKIRGELSEGMICAEDEIGLGTSHDGIMVLDSDAVIGTPAAEYFSIESDYMLEVDLTPNRIDAGSHLGVARDLAAYLKQQGNDVNLVWPSIDGFAIDNTAYSVKVNVENNEACPRYTGITVSDITVKESPEWLKNRLKAIGMTPINNVVDVTNFVLHECGQPLHAFDGDKVSGNKIVVRTEREGAKFVTLDGIERALTADDLMICNENEGMCIGGVFGGLHSGVTNQTKRIFLESAYFNPVWIRKTARRHQLSTDSSFRFERGVDPSRTLWALKRAALLIKEVAGGTLSSEITDVYPQPVKPSVVEFSVLRAQKLIGKSIAKEEISSILHGLEIKILEDKGDVLLLEIPTYRVDVTREADVVEDVLRIYGYNNVEISGSVKSTLSYVAKPDDSKLKNKVSDMLSSQGFNEIMNNSLSRSGYYEGLETFPSTHCVAILNPLSNDLNVMRQTLLFGCLETAVYNQNRRSSNLKLYEFGNCYYFNPQSESNANKPLAPYTEVQHLAILLSGNVTEENWNAKEKQLDFYDLKGFVVNLLKKTGISVGSLIAGEIDDSDLIESGMSWLTRSGETLVYFGKVSRKLQKQFDIENPVFYADINWDVLLSEHSKAHVSFSEIGRYPEVRRDLALLIDKSVQFTQIEALAYKTERKLLKRVSLFDVYEGNKLPEGKKSYAVSFILQDDDKTLTDKQIEKTMSRLVEVYSQELGAVLR